MSHLNSFLVNFFAIRTKISAFDIVNVILRIGLYLEKNYLKNKMAQSKSNCYQVKRVLIVFISGQEHDKCIKWSQKGQKMNFWSYHKIRYQ
jgi:hypothetical protein